MSSKSSVTLSVSRMSSPKSRVPLALAVFAFCSSNSSAVLASVLLLMSLAACSLICKYVNFNLGIGEQARNREVNRRNGREEEGGEEKECFLVRRRGNDIISYHFLQKKSFRQGF